MARERPDPGAWARLSDEETAEREAEERASSAPVATRPPAAEPLDPDAVQRRILEEMEQIRFRVGALLLFLVIVPIAVGVVIGLGLALR